MKARINVKTSYILHARDSCLGVFNFTNAHPDKAHNDYDDDQFNDSKHCYLYSVLARPKID